MFCVSDFHPVLILFRFIPWQHRPSPDKPQSSRFLFIFYTYSDTVSAISNVWTEIFFFIPILNRYKTSKQQTQTLAVPPVPHSLLYFLLAFSSGFLFDTKMEVYLIILYTTVTLSKCPKYIPFVFTPPIPPDWCYPLQLWCPCWWFFNQVHIFNMVSLAGVWCKALWTWHGAIVSP